ncbi:MAG: hypothetical protein QW512_02705 [Thermofilaceae archaeon]
MLEAAVRRTERELREKIRMLEESVERAEFDLREARDHLQKLEGLYRYVPDDDPEKAATLTEARKAVEEKEKILHTRREMLEKARRGLEELRRRVAAEEEKRRGNARAKLPEAAQRLHQARVQVLAALREAGQELVALTERVGPMWEELEKSLAEFRDLLRTAGDYIDQPLQFMVLEERNLSSSARMLWRKTTEGQPLPSIDMEGVIRALQTIFYYYQRVGGLLKPFPELAQVFRRGSE